MRKPVIGLSILCVSFVLINCGWLKKEKNDRTPSQYNVTFNSQGGTSITDQLVIEGRHVVEPNPPTKTGYLFAGWYKDDSYSDDWDFDNDTVDHAITLYAKWNNYSYTVNFNSDSATTEASPNQKTVVTPATTVDALPTPPVRNGYYFAGWYTVAGGNGTEFLATTTVTGNITVYAHWASNPTYTVTFDSQEATTPANPTSKTVVSPAYTVGTLPSSPLKTGYNFGGWYTETNGAGTEFHTDTIVTESVTVFAKWNTYSYTVSFNSQGGSSVSDKTVASPATTVGTLPSDPTRAGYAFGGWWTETNGGGTQFSGGTTVAGNLIVYAYWVPNHNTITFNANGGTGSMAEQTIDTGVTESLDENTYTKDGYSFAGWATDAEGEVVYENGDDYTMGIESVTLFAKWTPNNYTVSFDPNTGSGTMDPQTIACDATAKLNANEFTKEGYSFAGWATSSAGLVVYDDGDDFTMGIESVTLYAKWNIVIPPEYGTGEDGDITISGANVYIDSIYSNLHPGQTYDPRSGYTINAHDVLIESGTNLYASAWNGVRGGYLDIRCTGTLTIKGNINMTRNGYRNGGPGPVASGIKADGEGYATGGGKGTPGYGNVANYVYAGSGGGGAHLNNGVSGWGSGGTAYGIIGILTMGSAGGSGGGLIYGQYVGAPELYGGMGGNGGGIISIHAVKIIHISGTITANGGSGQSGIYSYSSESGPGGGGAGGYIYIRAFESGSNIIMGNLQVNAGAGGAGSSYQGPGGSGSVGIIDVVLP